MGFNYLIRQDDNGAAHLTNDIPGAPVLRLTGRGETREFGPEDVIGSFERGEVRAADVVMAWGSQLERTPEEVEAAKAFLSRWPDGPQLRSLDAKCPPGGGR